MDGKTVLLRAGFDVPMEHGQVKDAERIDILLPTMRRILDHGALVILSHQGRPKGKVDQEFSQRPLVPILTEKLGREVLFAESPTGEKTVEMAKALKNGDILLVENLRFDPREEKNDASFAKELAQLGHIYVNDAFTNCHRSHASMVALAELLPAYAGLQLEKEVTYLGKVVDDPRRPLTLVISGAKMETKIPVITQFLDRGDDVLTGGCIANTFLAARGFDVGASLYEQEFVDACQELMLEAEKSEKADIHLPQDVLVASGPEGTEALDLPAEDVEGDMQILDIGKVAAERFAKVIDAAGMIVWNGPVGMSEKEPFSNGSKRIAHAVAAATKRGATTIVGGGDTIGFHRQYGLPLDAYSFVSTGGGAMLEFLAGTEFPALAPLVEK